MSANTISPEKFRHSPVHYAVALADHSALTRLLSSLPKLADPAQIHTESDSITQEHLADKISSVLDRRDNPDRETPLHLAVRLNDAFAADTLSTAGADISLQNAAGWNVLQEAVCRRNIEIISILVQHHHISAWSKWRRRLPRLVTALRRMRDFYMEISFHFESSIVPFVGKIAPSDTYKIWKRNGNLRADTSLAGYDGLKIHRANQSFLFFGDTDIDTDIHNLDIDTGSLIVVNHDDQKLYDAFENAGTPLSESDISAFCSQTSVYRPGMDVTKAELIGRTNWRRQEKYETVGNWKARVYEINNVVFSFRSRKITAGENDSLPGNEQVLPLELEEDSDDGYLVAENPRVSVGNNRRRHSSFVREERDIVSVSRKSVDIIPERRRRPPAVVAVVPPPPQTKEKEFVKCLKPSVWLTEGFPLKTEELLPLLDILANKVKAVRRMRELLTTKFPAGSFPVKIAIPVVPTVRVVITFTKFVELQPIEEFYTPLSSPRQFMNGRGYEEDTKRDSNAKRDSTASDSSLNWLPHSSKSGSTSNQQEEKANPFAIPAGYIWSSFDERGKKPKKSKSSRKTK